MPNGKGSVDCGYRAHFDGGNSARHGDERLCRFHEVILPKAKDPRNNRICGNFEPSELYRAHNPFPDFCPLVRRFAWFGINLEPGVLMSFFTSSHPVSRNPQCSTFQIIKITLGKK